MKSTAIRDTDGSHSVRSFFDVLRESGATARLDAGKGRRRRNGGVPPTECSTNLHTVVHKASGKKLGYGELGSGSGEIRRSEKGKT